IKPLWFSSILHDLFLDLKLPWLVQNHESSVTNAILDTTAYHQTLPGETETRPVYDVLPVLFKPSFLVRLRRSPTSNCIGFTFGLRVDNYLSTGQFTRLSQPLIICKFKHGRAKIIFQPGRHEDDESLVSSLLYPDDFLDKVPVINEEVEDPNYPVL
ncbi:hypothetical protein V5O48_018621, partial [Marasmius crinis-equi]